MDGYYGDNEETIGISVSNDAPPRQEALDDVMTDYYDKGGVTSIISLKIDTKYATGLAALISDIENVMDVFLVTGDTDILVKAEFQSYKSLKDFLLNTLGNIDGVKEIKTMMVVTTFKENGSKIKQE